MGNKILNLQKLYLNGKTASKLSVNDIKTFFHILSTHHRPIRFIKQSFYLFAKSKIALHKNTQKIVTLKTLLLYNNFFKLKYRMFEISDAWLLSSMKNKLYFVNKLI